MRRLYCSLFGHHYAISKNITDHIKEYHCVHCSKQMTINAQGELIPLTSKFKEINEVLERIHFVKTSKQAQQLIFDR